MESKPNHILFGITYARLKIIHTFIITPGDLTTALKELSRTLISDSLPTPISYSNVASCFKIIELAAFRRQTEIVFVLKISLIELKINILFRLFPIKVMDNRTAL